MGLTCIFKNRSSEYKQRLYRRWLGSFFVSQRQRKVSTNTGRRSWLFTGADEPVGTTADCFELQMQVSVRIQPSC